MSILLSFIVPVFNGEKTLEQCLNSIQKIDFPKNKFEIIVVNNNSTDKTQDIAQKFPINLVTENNQGRSYARNRGAMVARGEILAFIDCDCTIDEMWATELLKLFKHDFIGAAQGAIIPIGSAQNSLNKFRFRRVHNYTNGSFIVLDVLTSNFPVLNSAAFMIRKNVFDQINGFDPSISRTEDADLAQRLFLSGFGLAAAGRAKAYVSWNDGQWKSYIARAWSVGKAVSEYQLKWSPSRFISIMQYWAYYLKRFFEFNYLDKNILFDLTIYFLIENLQLISFHFHLLTNKKNTTPPISQIYFTQLKTQLNSVSFHSNPHYSVALLTKKIVLFDLKNKKFALLNEASRSFFMDILEGKIEPNANSLLLLQQIGFFIKS